MYLYAKFCLQNRIKGLYIDPSCVNLTSTLLIHKLFFFAILEFDKLPQRKLQKYFIALLLVLCSWTSFTSKITLSSCLTCELVFDNRSLWTISNSHRFITCGNPIYLSWSHHEWKREDITSKDIFFNYTEVYVYK